MRESWTDERLDDFAKHVDQRFDRVEDELRSLRGSLGRIDGRIDDLHSAVIQLGVGAIATIVVGFLGVIATQL